jgi:solute carrier family 45 protein 1/2/4
MVIGSFVVMICLVFMAWAKEIVAIFMDEGDAAKTVTIFVAVLSIYAVDFAINVGEFVCIEAAFLNVH